MRLPSHAEWRSDERTLSRYRRAWGMDQLELPDSRRGGSGAVVLLCAGAMAAVYLAAFLLNF